VRDRFPGYYRPTQEQFQQMWEECIFSYDANVLLNVYRYSPATCEELFRIFQHLKDRTWLTHQAVLEYHENRQEVIEQQYNIYTDIEAPLMEASKKISERYSRRGHSFADTDLILQNIDKFKLRQGSKKAKRP
jgi:PIN like domain